MTDVVADPSRALPDRHPSERHVAEGGVTTALLAEESRTDCSVAVEHLRIERTAATRDRGEAQG